MKFTDSAQRVIALSRELAISYGHDYIDIIHLVLALLKDKEETVPTIITNLGVDTVQLQAQIHDFISTSRGSAVVKGSLPLTKRAESVLKDAKRQMDELPTNKIGKIDNIHIMLAIVKNPKETTWIQFGDERLTYDLFLNGCKSYVAQREIYYHLVTVKKPKSFFYQLKKLIGLID